MVDPPISIRADPWSLGPWLGWLSILAVFVAVATDRAGPHPQAIVALVTVGASLNAGVLLVPARFRTYDEALGRMMLDAWCGGVISFASILVIVGGAASDFDWLFMLVMPFIASAQQGWRRSLWLTVGLSSFLVATLAAPTGITHAGVPFRFVVIVTSVVLVLVMSETIAQEAQARSEAATRAQLERLLVAEAHHRVKNSLQQVSELLQLARPPDASGVAFDETAARIRSIAAVHQVLEATDGTDAPADAVVRQVVSGIDPDIVVTSEPVRLSAAQAQQLGIVTNELVSNSVRHASRPITVSLSADPQLRLEVTDRGDGYDMTLAKLGLRLVRQIVEQGLKGTLTVSVTDQRANVTRVEFDIDHDPPR